MHKSNTENSKYGILEFRRDFQEVLNLLTLLFDPRSLLPFLRYFIFWMTSH